MLIIKIPIPVQKKSDVIFVMPIIVVREPYMPTDEDGRVTWLKNFTLKLASLVGVLAAVTNTILTATQVDSAWYEYVVNLAKAVETYSTEVTAYKNKCALATPGAPLPAAPSFNPPTAPLTAAPSGILNRIALLVDSIKSDPNYDVSMGHDLDIIGAENTIDTDTITPEIKGKLIGNRYPRLKTAKKGMDAYNLYADYRDGNGMRFIARVTTFRKGYVDNHPVPSGQDSAVFDYQCQYVLNDEEVGRRSATVSLTVTRV